MFDGWSRGEKITFASLIVGLIACFAALAVVPEVRLWISGHLPGRSAHLDVNAASANIALSGILPTFAAERKLLDEMFLQRLCQTRLARSDLQGLTPYQLRVLRNAIYAFHGRPFAAADLRQVFSVQPWYRADQFYSDRRLTQIDDQNVVLIMSEEGHVGYHE
jgi:YARHG domain